MPGKICDFLDDSSHVIKAFSVLDIGLDFVKSSLGFLVLLSVPPMVAPPISASRSISGIRSSEEAETVFGRFAGFLLSAFLGLTGSFLCLSIPCTIGNCSVGPALAASK